MGKDPTELLENIIANQENCNMRGHPHPQEVICPYYGGASMVKVQCTGCGTIYSRRPTPEEISEYEDVFKLEFLPLS